MRRALVLGAILGVAYTLSPLTVISLAAMTAVVAWAARDLGPRERAWFLSTVTVAVLLRLAAIAALFLLADPSRPYANFFGDEELFKSETIWLRNVGYGLPMSPADLIYVFDEVGRSSYMNLLAYLQALVGDAPYGANVLNVAIYVIAILVLFRFIRGVYGRVTALAGATILLFVPSLFSWSISVLKEPAYMLFAALELICASQIVLARTWPRRIFAVAGVIVLAAVLGSLRVGGTQLAVAGSLIAIPLGLLATRPRLMWAAIVVAPIAIVVAAMQPAVQQRATNIVQEAAFMHWGHVATPGHSYRLLDQRFYAGHERKSVYTMDAADMTRYVVRAAGQFLTAPRASQIESRLMVGYLPEQAVWYVMLLLLPFGFAAGMRRAPVVTAVLAAHGAVAAAMVALTGGNIGTLIRHRGLVLPYVTWLAVVGGCALLQTSMAAASRQRAVSPTPEHS